MKKIAIIICTICAMLVASSFGAKAQNALAENTASNMAYTVTKIDNNENIVDAPDGYYMTIKNGKLNTYLPLSAYEEFQMLETSNVAGVIFKNQPVQITTTEKKGLYTSKFTVHQGPERYDFTLVYSDSETAQLTVRNGRGFWIKFHGVLTK